MHIEMTTEQRILEAAALLPPHGAVTGWAALHWLGATRWFSGVGADESLVPIPLAVGGEVSVSEVEALAPGVSVRFEMLKAALQPVGRVAFSAKDVAPHEELSLSVSVIV